jgi:hypothetical protein
MIILLLLALGVIAHAVDSNGEEGWRDVDLDVEIYRTFIARENLNFVEELNKNPDAGFRMHPYREFWHFLGMKLELDTSWTQK